MVNVGVIYWARLVVVIVVQVSLLDYVCKHVLESLDDVGSYLMGLLFKNCVTQIRVRLRVVSYEFTIQRLCDKKLRNNRNVI